MPELEVKSQPVPSKEDEIKLKVVCGANDKELENMTGYTHQRSKRFNA